jgi:subtilisin family serine protease
MKCGVLVLAAAMALSACARLPPVAAAGDHAAPGRATLASVSAMDSQRDIVLAVANPLAPPATHAGSSLLGYLPSANYGIGQRAASTLAALKKIYGWQEVTGWPIKALDVYCIVLTPPPGMSRDTQNLVDADRTAFDRDNHGTEVAGVIAATADNHRGIVGIAPGAVLSVYKACWYPPVPGAGARCNTFTLAKALAAVIDTDTRIINLSLGGPADPLLDELLSRLLEQGRIVITAMPPDGNVGGFPDRAPGVIVVRTSRATEAPPGVLSAPGSDILTTQPGGGYDFTSGSSMAAAHVSGITALLLAMAPALDARSVHDLLLQSSRVSDGMLQVNAAAAMARLRERRKAGR